MGEAKDVRSTRPNRWRQMVAAGAMLALAMSFGAGKAGAQAAAKVATQPGTVFDLKVGDMAPDFKLRYFDGTSLKDVSLADYRGKKNVALAFYVFAFTGG